MNSVLFIQMGGSIDKNYPFKANNKEFEITEPAFELILPRIVPAFLHRFESICKKDSLEITEHDNELLRSAIDKAPEKHIVVTVGTDRMAEIATSIKISEKTVVFTGAYLPVFMKETDADFNIGFAVAGSITLPHGVYVAMNGRFLDPKKTKKNKTTLVFEESNLSSI